MKNAILLLFLTFVSCNSQSKSDNQNDPIVNVSAEDIEMNKAIQTAKNTLKDFNNALILKNANFNSFALKVKFEDGEDVEHVWLSYIEKRNGEFFGVVDNLPEKITNLKLGDTIKIEKSKITDWMFLEKTKLNGGFTIRVLRNRMNEAEKKKFDSECGFEF
ncbi:DUF2314 domain-containing protein [Flavobacterium sp. BFFFF1]|uniref:YegJ family protein n=1 Tax=Flavobacterium sp. BFFFF1 TaxID=2015557 RepID=UPI0025BFFB96|nr:DUF2314 domain-containing protein [Flavobacterium sp. BFFFF1]